MAFAGFELSQIEVDDPKGPVSLRVRHGGSGPPLLLLHGHPETHMMWGKIANELATDFTVVAADLRGYGKSTKPPSSDDNETSSKRAMARDAVALMKHFGFETFDVAGHDRGGRVAYRLALDHPAAVRRVSVMDIIPTGEVWARIDHRFALGYWHWSFLAQPYPVPEHLIGPDPEFYLFTAQFRGRKPDFLEPEAQADYLACGSTPDVIHGMCECYRAGAGYDRVLDWADKKAGRKIERPLQVLWGSKGAVGQWYDPLAVWREWADDVRGQAIECGHFLPEENPADTLAALRDFFLEGR
jgi:haloacetate dehalogenase